jgi:glyoxylase-like metal-dependent hydrolase (beta-lactamase superfamily II)
MERRRFLASAASASLAGAAGLGFASSMAHAATSKTFTHGAFEVTVISDGHLVVPTSFLALNARPDELHAAIAAAGQRGERVELPTNVTLVRTQSDLILIDTGAGPHYMPTAGKLLANMEAAGIKRDDITKVVFSHAHPDHIWGTLDDFDDAPNFPNASYVIAAAEWNFWMGPDVAARLPEHRQNFAPGARRNLLRIKDRIETIKPGAEIVPGLRSVDTAGHTQGHIALEMVAGNDALLVVGDALAHPTIAFAYPDWRPDSDHEPDRAAATRKALLDRLATDRSRIVGYHLPFPGIGGVERKGTAYTYVAGG